MALYLLRTHNQKTKYAKIWQIHKFLFRFQSLAPCSPHVRSASAPIGMCGKSAMESGIFALFRLLAMGYSHCLYSSLRTARENPKLTAWSRSLLAAVRRFILRYSSARAT